MVSSISMVAQVALAYLCLVVPSSATHFRYGVIEWKWKNIAGGVPVAPFDLEVTITHAWRVGVNWFNHDGQSTNAKCDGFDADLNFDWDDGTKVSLKRNITGAQQLDECGVEASYGNRVIETQTNFILAKAKIVKRFNNANARTINIAGCCRLNSGTGADKGLNNNQGKPYKVVAYVVSNTPYGPSAASFAILQISEGQTSAKMNLAASVNKWDGAKFAPKSFIDNALRIEFTPTDGNPATGGDWGGDTNGNSLPNTGSGQMTIPDATKGSIQWNTNGRKNQPSGTPSLYSINVKVTDVASGSWSLLDILVEVVTKSPDFCAAACSPNQVSDGTAGLKCTANSDCYSGESLKSPNPYCQWYVGILDELKCTNCEGGSGAMTKTAPEACISNKAATLRIEHPSCIAGRTTCTIKALVDIELTFYVVAEDVNSNDDALIKYTNLPGSATLVESVGTNPTRRLFRWTPSAADALKGNSPIFQAQSTGEGADNSIALTLSVDTKSYPIYITGILRDFKNDFFKESRGASAKSLFGTSLSDGFDPQGKTAETQKWFVDSADSLSRAHTIRLDPAGTNQWSTFTCSAGGTASDWGRETCTKPFVPLDNTMFENQGDPHNYFYTYSAAAGFSPSPGKTITFSARNDMYVFVDGQLVLDMGGSNFETHTLTIQGAGASCTAGSCTMTGGNTGVSPVLQVPARFHIFYGNRFRPTGTADMPEFNIQTTFPLTCDVIAAGEEAFRYDGTTSFPFTGINLNGDASTDAAKSSIKLTKGLTGRAGSVWYPVRQSVLTGFEALFTFKISGGSGRGSGLAFVLQNDVNSVVGQSAFGIGYDGIKNGFAIEFDTQKDTTDNLQDPDDCHLSLHYARTSGGVDPTKKLAANEFAGDGVVAGGLVKKTVIKDQMGLDWADGQEYSVRVVYQGKKLTVEIKRGASGSWKTPISDLPMTFAEGDILDTVLGASQVYVGFTAATGFNNQQQVHEIKKWNFKIIGVGPNTVSAAVSSKTVEAGFADTFIVTAKDACTNPVGYGGMSSQFEVALYNANPSSPCDGVPVKTGSMEDFTNGTYAAKYTATVAANLDLCVQFGQTSNTRGNIAGSPFSINVEAAASNAGQVDVIPYLTSYDSVAGVAFNLGVQAKDVYGNLVKKTTLADGSARNDDFSFSVVGEATCDDASLDCNNVDGVPKKLSFQTPSCKGGTGANCGLWALLMTPEKTGTYHVSVKLGTIPVQHSPFTVQVKPGQHYPKNSIGQGASLSGGIVGELQKFTIVCKDRYNNDLTESPSETPKVTITAKTTRRLQLLGLASTRQLSTTATATPTSMRDGTWTVEYTIEGASGREWEISVKFRDNVLNVDEQPIKDSPFTAIYTPGTLSADHTTADGVGYTTDGVAGVSNSIVIQSRDKYSNQRVAVDATDTNWANSFTVAVSPQDGNFQQTLGAPPELGAEALYPFEWTTEKSNQGSPTTVTITVTSGGKNIKASPASVYILPNVVAHTKSKVQSNEVCTGAPSCKAGEPVSFTLEARDTYDNVRIADGAKPVSQDQWLVSFVGSAASSAYPVPDCKVSAQADCVTTTFKSAGQYTATFTPQVADPSFTPTIQVRTLDGYQTLIGSTKSNTKIVPADVDPSKCSATGQGAVSAVQGEATNTFKVLSRDRFSNLRLAEAGSLDSFSFTLFKTATGGASTDTDVAGTCATTSGNQFAECTYATNGAKITVSGGTGFAAVATYYLEIKFGTTVIGDGSRIPISVYQSPPDVSKVELTGSGKDYGVAGSNSNIFTMTVKDSAGGEIKANSQNVQSEIRVLFERKTATGYEDANGDFTVVVSPVNKESTCASNCADYTVKYLTEKTNPGQQRMFRMKVQLFGQEVLTKVDHKIYANTPYGPYSEVSGAGLFSAVAGAAGTFEIQVSDTYNNTYIATEVTGVAGNANLYLKQFDASIPTFLPVTISSASGPLTAAEGSFTLKTLNNGKFQCEYTFKKAKRYTVVVNMKYMAEAVTKVYQGFLDVAPGDISATNSRLREIDGVTMKLMTTINHPAGESRDFFVDPLDQFDNRLEKPDAGNFVVEIKRGTDAALSYTKTLVTDVSSNQYNMYRITYSGATKAGDYAVSVKYGADAVGGGPYALAVVAAAPDFATSKVVTKIGNHVVGSEQTFQIQVMDRFSNPRIGATCITSSADKTCDQFSVYLTPFDRATSTDGIDSCMAAANSETPLANKIVPVQTAGGKHDAGKYDISLTLLKAAAYRVTIQLRGGDIVDSGYDFDADAAAINAQQSLALLSAAPYNSVDDITNLVAGSQFTFKIEPKDEYKNCIKVLPTDLKFATSGIEFINGAPNNNIVSCELPAGNNAGSASNPCLAKQVASGTSKLSAAADAKSINAYVVTGTLLQSGDYTINIKTKDGKPVSNSPAAGIVYPAPATDKDKSFLCAQDDAKQTNPCSTTMSYPAGTAIGFYLKAKDKYGNWQDTNKNGVNFVQVRYTFQTSGSAVTDRMGVIDLSTDAETRYLTMVKSVTRYGVNTVTDGSKYDSATNLTVPNEILLSNSLTKAGKYVVTGAVCTDKDCTQYTDLTNKQAIEIKEGVVSTAYSKITGAGKNYTVASAPSSFKIALQDNFDNVITDGVKVAVTMRAGAITGSGFTGSGDLIGDGNYKLVFDQQNGGVKNRGGGNFDVDYTISYPGAYKIEVKVLQADKNGVAQPCSDLDNNEPACVASKACRYIPAQGAIANAKCEEMVLDCPSTVAKQNLDPILCDGDLFKLTAIEETCAGKDNGAKPYTCPAASGGCTVDFQECIKLGGASPCPADKPISCWQLSTCLKATPTEGAKCAQDHCKAKLSECGCPPGYQTCASDGSCVFDVRLCPANCPAEKPVACPDKTCAATNAGCASSIACPAGSITCFDAKTCAGDISGCPQPLLCSGARPLTCPDGKTCVSSYAECPTQQICPANTVLCPDSSCRPSSTDCAALTGCYYPTPYQCADGSCTNFLANCPTSATCPASQSVFCADKSCKPTLQQCPPLPTQCDSKNPILCPDGSCQQSSKLCPSVSTCPASQPIKCPDGSCQESSSACLEDFDCAPDRFGQKTYKCPDGSCVINTLTCPTSVSCPPTHPTKCWDSSCVVNATQCVQPAVSCPARSPIRCPTGACVASFEDCPQDTRCSTKWPVKCIDGSCKESIDKCPAVDTNTGTACTAGQVRCPVGSCAPSLGLCPKSISCQYGEVKCWDGSCRFFNASTNTDPCPDKLLDDSACPKSGFETTTGSIRCPDGACVFNLNECPTGSVCPPETPVLCPDKSCNESLAQCPNFSPCPSTKVLCPDGTCQRLEEDCGRPVTCTALTPYKCFDQTCRMSPDDCPVAPKCPLEKPFLCSDGNCKETRESCIFVGKCKFLDCYGEGYCIRCPGDLGDKGNYDTSRKCSSPKGCLKNGCAREASHCYNYQVGTDNGVSQTGECLQGFTRCPVDGSCRKFEDPNKCKDVNDFETCEYCPKPACPAHVSFRCSSGQCAKAETDCSDTTSGCPPSQTRCNDGVCAATCSSTVQNATCATLGVTGGKTLCLDGSCRDSCDKVAYANGCSKDKPIRCAGSGKKCVSAEKDCVLEQYCKDPFLFRCDNGQCVVSSLHCARTNTGVDLDSGCPDTSPVPCADGTCATSSEQCSALNPCPSGESRCTDGSCEANLEDCPVGGVHDGVPNDPTDGTKSTTFCPLVRPYRCEAGTCAAARNECVNLDQNDAVSGVAMGCTPKHPKWCPISGACIEQATSCSTTTSSTGPGNGCASGTPVKCLDGSCQTSTSQCKAASGCSADKPLRCPDGSCASEFSNCPASDSCPSATSVRCADGSCAATFSACLTSNFCPLGSPIRCADGSCASSPSKCKARVVCPGSFPVLCADGACVGASGLCRPSSPCPAATSHKCSDLTCAVSPSNCTSREQNCPSTTPSRCPNGQCVSSPSDCTNWPDAAGCPASSPVKCFDGGCSTSAVGCIGSTTQVINTTTTTTKDPVTNKTTTTSTTVVTQDTTVRPIGNTTLPTSAVDPTAGKCPTAHPVKCVSGDGKTTKCVVTAGECVCGAGKALCSDGTCKDAIGLCPTILGCRMSTPKRCADGSCVAVGAACNIENPITTGPCPAGATRCADGLCRTGGCPTTNGCSGPTPVMCPDGSCQKDSGASTCLSGTLGVPSWVLPPADNKCSANEVLCADHTCAADGAACDSKLRTADVVPTTVSTSCATGQSQFSLASSDGKSAAKLRIPSGTFSTCGTVPVQIGPVAESEVSGITHKVDWTRTGTFGETLAYSQMALSTLVRVHAGTDIKKGNRRRLANGGSKDAPLPTKVEFQFRVDFVPRGHPKTPEKDLCLAFVNATNQWECVDTDLTFVEINVYRGYSPHMNGIYGVVLFPFHDPAPLNGCPESSEGQNQCSMTGDDARAFLADKEEWANNDALCCNTLQFPSCDKCPGIWDLYWWAFVIGIGVFVLIALITSYVLYRMSRYRKKWKMAKAIMMQDMGGEGLVLFKDAVKTGQEPMFAPAGQDEMLTNNPMFEIERDNLQRKQAALDEDLANQMKGEIEGKDATIEALLKEKKAMQERMRMMLQKQQVMEDRANKSGGSDPRRAKKTQFAPTSALD